MSSSLEASSFHSELVTVQSIIADLQRRWPAPIALEPGRASDYFALPYLFRDAFPQLTAEQLRPLAVFCKIYAGSILLQDRLIDGQLGGNAAALATAALRITAMHAEAYHALHAILPASARFWDRLRDYLAAYTEACLDEQRFTSGARPWSEYTEEVALRIIVGKNGPARIIAAAMAELAGDEQLLEPLLAVTNAFNIATQLWDDLQDWKEDLRRGAPSLLLARMVPERPVGLDDEGWARLLRRLARDLYYGGHARRVLDLALASLDTAEQLKATIPRLGLHAKTRALRRWCEALRADIDRIVRANVERAREQAAVALELGEATEPWQHVAWDALRFVEAQWKLGFGEGRDLMQYPAELGFDTGDTCYFGDVFQRALLADALCDADLALDGRLASILESEAQYLVGQRLRSATGGWRYFANLPELPPDADDLGQVVQALLRAGRRDDVARHAEAPLRVLLRDQSHDDGSFDTWIVPATGRTPLEDRHAALVERVWGTGADCDVMPNLLHALHLYDGARFSDAIHRGAAYLEAHQHGDGSWASRWYAGPYYAIHVNLRMFAAVAPASPAVARALAHLRAAQRPDGGWGLDGAASDPLSTALALLGLAAVRTDARTDDPADRDRAARGIAALRAMAAGGAWPAHKLIFKGVGAFHGSRTLTTTFVLKAALAWRA